MPSAVWTGYLTFGLVSIPIRLHAAARAERISLKQLHTICYSRLKQPLFCALCNRMVEKSEITKGYEHEKDQFVILRENELRSAEPPSGRVAEIISFVDIDVFDDPLSLDDAYYVIPEAAGVKAYRLLQAAMHRTNCAAIAKLTMHGREHAIFLRSHRERIILHTMFYGNEIRTPEVIPEADLTKKEIDLAEQLIRFLIAPFENTQTLGDGYKVNLENMITDKLKGQQPVESAPPRLAPVIDLMESLKKSLRANNA